MGRKEEDDRIHLDLSPEVVCYRVKRRRLFYVDYLTCLRFLFIYLQLCVGAMVIPNFMLSSMHVFCTYNGSGKRKSGKEAGLV